MDDQRALLQAIAVAPNDHGLRLIYADWLEEHGDSFAAYVQAECVVESSAAGSAEWNAAIERMLALVRAASAPLGGWRFEPTLTRIGTKLGRVRSALRNRGEPAPDLPLVPEADLLQFEIRHGITLPAEYRAFLLRIGNEQIGTGQGLVPLPLGGDIPALRTPFPNSPEVIQHLLQEMIYIRVHQGELPLMATGEVEVKLTALGCLTLVALGSSNEMYLLGVNGSARGQVWTHGDWYGPLPNEEGEVHNFLSWYEEWLDNWADEELGIGASG